MTQPVTRPTRDNPFGEAPAAAKARRSRNLAIAAALVGFIILVFVLTLLNLSRPHVG